MNDRTKALLQACWPAYRYIESLQSPYGKIIISTDGIELLDGNSCIPTGAINKMQPSDIQKLDEGTL